MKLALSSGEGWELIDNQKSTQIIIWKLASNIQTLDNAVNDSVSQIPLKAIHLHAYLTFNQQHERQQRPAVVQ